MRKFRVASFYHDWITMHSSNKNPRHRQKVNYIIQVVKMSKVKRQVFSSMQAMVDKALSDGGESRRF